MIKDTKNHRKIWPLLAVAICTLACVVVLTRFERTLTAAGEIVPDQPRFAIAPIGAMPNVLPPCQAGQAEAVEPDVPLIMFHMVCAESPASAHVPMETISAELDKRLNAEKDSAVTREMMEEIFDELADEKKLTIFSRPVVMSHDKEMAVVFIGSRESNCMISVIPRLMNGRILAHVALKKDIDADTLENTTKTYQCSTLAMLQENSPLLAGGLKLQSEDGKEDKEIVLCITAKIIPPKKAAE